MGPNLHDYWPFIPDWLPIKSYGMFVALGFLAAALLAYRRSRKVGINGDAILDLALWAVVSGVVGARLFYVVQFFGEQFAGRPIVSVFAIHQGGLVFYGGLLTAVPVCVWYMRRRRLPVWRTLDVTASVVMVGLAFGRLGCFSYGCCWGVPTDSAWGVVFPPGAPPYAHPDLEWGTPLFPIQLLSSFNAFVIFAALSFQFHRLRKRDGDTAALLLVLYPVNRFVLEIFRHDTHAPGSLSVSQWVSAIMFAGGVALFALARHRPQAASAPCAAEPGDTADAPAAHTSKSKKRRMKK